MDTQLRDLIRRMATENRWGAPRIHGELLKLGFRVSERTVSRYVRVFRPRGRPGASWRSFLNNHRDVLAAMDLFTVPTVTFRLLYVLFVIHHDRRRVLHANVTARPTAAWVCQQLREAFPFDVTPRYLLLDGDCIFSAEVSRVLRHMGVRPVRTSFQSPWQNGVAERWVGICRCELLAHVIVLNETHLRRLVGSFLLYYHSDRTHIALGKDPPTTRAVCLPASPRAAVASVPRVGGLHHRYEWRDAA